MAGFLDSLTAALPQLPSPFSGGLVAPPPFVTPPPPPRLGPPPQEQTDIPLSDFVTPMPEAPPIGAGHTTPQEELLTPGTSTPTPEAIRQQLIDAGFGEEGADAVTGLGGTLQLSPERIEELLDVRGTDDPATRIRVRDVLTRVLSDPRIRDEYTRGMTGIYADVRPNENALGDYNPASQAANIYDVEARLGNPGGESNVHSTASHEIGHHIANQMLNSTYLPEGWAAAIQLDHDHNKRVNKGEIPGPASMGPDSGWDAENAIWVSQYAKSGQSRGAAIAEDFADAMRARLSPHSKVREQFRAVFPARAAFIDALLYAMVNPDKAGEKLGVAREREGSDFGIGRGTMGPFDQIVGRASAARNLLEQEIALWRGRGREDIAADLSSKRADDKLMPRYFDQRVTHPAILQALRTFQQGGYRYDQETE